MHRRIWAGAFFTMAVGLCTTALAADEQWVVYEGKEGPGQGKHIVLVSGDEEYRSEEALPQLGKILAVRHGFKCTVVFAVDPKTGEINPDVNNNIPGLEALKTADLMIIATRFRNLPDEQMRHVADYVNTGKPIIGMRTATHAFNIPGGKKYSSFSWRNSQWKNGFGQQVLGETWISHHGHHGKESTRGIIAEGKEKHPILTGIKSGDIWGPTDVYGVVLNQFPDRGIEQLVLGQVLAGMEPDSEPVEGKKNEPMMPVAWTKDYTAPNGKTGRAFTTTMGASQDLLSEGTRRMLVNAVYWALNLKIPPKNDVTLVGKYKPTRFKFGGYTKGVKPSDHAMKE